MRNLWTAEDFIRAGSEVLGIDRRMGSGFSVRFGHAGRDYRAAEAIS
jgi:hypothetical protein